MLEEMTFSDVLTPRLKLWNTSNKFSTVTQARTSNNGEHIAVLTGSRHVHVTHVKRPYEDAVYDEVRQLIWSVCDWRNEKSMDYPSCTSFLVTTRVDHYINVFSISTSDSEEKLFRCSMVAVVEPLTLYCNESITSISQLSVVCALGSLDGSAHQIICVVNQTHLIHIVLSPPEKPYVARVLALSTLTEKPGDLIKEQEYRDGVLYVLTEELMLYVLRSADFLLLQAVNVYEKFQLIDVVQFAVTNNNGLHTVMFIESACQMHFMKLRPLQKEDTPKPSYSWNQTDIWKDRLRHTKSQYKQKRELKCVGKDEMDCSSVPLLNWMEDFSIQQVNLSSAAVIMVQKNPNKSKPKLLTRFDFSDQKFSFTEIPSEVCVSFCWNSKYPLYYVSNAAITVPTFGTTQEAIIDAILQYSDIQVAESVCKSNDWDQFSVPLHTLQVGIQHKQLDVISFFLKSRQNVFTRYWESVSDLADEEKNSALSNENSTFNEMYNAIDMLVDAVVTNSQREHKQNFFEGLLRVTIIYFNGLIQNGIEALEIKSRVLPHTDSNCKEKEGDLRRNSSFSIDIPSTLGLLSNKLIELRTFLRHPMEKEELDCVDESKTESVLSKGNIELYLLNGQIGLLQKLLKEQKSDGKLSTVITIGRNIVNRLLKEQNIEKAETILINLGLESSEELKVVYEHKMECTLRDFLHVELQNKELLSKKDMEDYSFIIQVEDLHRNEYLFSMKTNLKLALPVPLSSELPLRLRPKNIDTTDDSSETSSSIALFSIDHVKCWDRRRKNLIVFDGVFSSLAQVSLSGDSSSDLWEYLTSHNSLPLLQQWVDQKNSFSQDTDSLVFPDLPEQMPINLASPVTVEELLHLMVKNGHYPSSFVEHFSHLFPYLCKGVNVFNKVHPMVKYRKDISDDERDDLVRRFNDNVLCFCQENDLLMVLWHYVCHYKIPMSIVTVEDRFKSWLSLILSFHDVVIEQEEDGRELTLFTVFSENARFLATKSCKSYSLIDMLQNNQVIIALASLLVCSNLLISYLNFNEQTSQIEIELWRKSLHSYRQIYRVLFPQDANSGPRCFTMYQLLHSNGDLDVSCWFRWVSHNRVEGKGGGLSEMPHFSSTPLVKNYAFEVMLDHQFYLEQYRPTLAFMVCMSDSTQLLDNKVPAMNLVLTDAYHAGLDNVGNLPVVTSCSFFLELLDIDSEKLKIDARVCNTITSCWDLLEGGFTEEDLRKRVVDLFLVKKNQRKLETVLKLLEDATEVIIQKNNINKISYDAIWCWQLVLSFCRIHNLPFSTRFIENCCKANDWLHLFVFLHFYQVPSEDVISTLEKSMKNRILKEHIIAVLQSTRIVPVAKAEDKVRRRKRDISRSKSRKDKEISILMSSLQRKEENNACSPHALSPSEKTALDVQSNFKLFDAVGLPDNLIDIIVLCEEHDTPWRSLLAHGIVLSNEMFAILAMCYSNADVIACQCTWYICSVGTKDNNLMHQICNALLGVDICIKDVPLALQTHCWSPKDLLTVMERIALEGVVYSQLLTCGYRIFRDGDIAVFILEFFHEFLYEADEVTLLGLIQKFQFEFEKMRNHETSGSNIPLEDDIVFYELVSSGMISTLASMCTNVSSVNKLVILLSDANYGNTFSINVPNYTSIRKIVELVYGGGVMYPLEKLFTSSESVSNQHINEIFDLLLKHGSFDQASELAQMYCLPPSKISLQKVIKEHKEIAETDAWKEKSIRQAFIDKCDKFFFKQKCCCEMAGGFFEGQALSGISFYTNSEKSNLLMLAMQWYHRSIIGDKSTKISELEKEVWMHQIKAEVESEVDPESSSIPEMLKVNLDENSDARPSYFNRTCSDMGMLQFNDSTELLQENCEVPSENPSINILSDPEEYAAFERVIGKLLDRISITEAKRVASYFQKKTRDLEIVLAAIALAQGGETVDGLSEDMKAILAATTSRHISISGLLERSGSFTQLDNLNSPVQPSGGCMKEFVFIEEVQNALEKLALRVKYGKKCLQQILVCFKIASMSGKSYEAVVTDNVYCVLGQVLSKSIDTRRQISRQFIKAFDLPADDVGNFVGETMTSWIKVSSGLVPETIGSTESGQSESPSATYTYDQITSLLQLTENKSQVGNIILQGVVELSNTSQCRSTSELSCEVELLVHAHHCFSLCCDMEGIAAVLHFAGLCTKSLARLQLHSQMARLLTGIGRFNEMVYVIETLYNQHHFEILCHQGHAKEESLKKALLDFLRKYHPKDHDNFHIVAHGFGMYREMAQHHKSVALEKMNSVIKEILNGSNNSKDIGATLKDMRKVFLYAADYYLKEECVSHAQKCTRLARLVEVQAQLPTGVCVLGLSNESVVNFLLKHKNFLESYMVADSYELPVPDCFVEPLFHNVVVNGNRVYLEQFQKYFRLTPSTVSQVVGFYQKEKKNEALKGNMQHLLSKLHDVKTKLKWTRDLNFSDMEKELLEGCGGAYLRDSSF